MPSPSRLKNVYKAAGIEPLHKEPLFNYHIRQKARKTIDFPSFLHGGDKRDRTADLLNAIQTLSQLSYTPTFYHIHFLFGAISVCRFAGCVPLSTSRDLLNAIQALSQLSYTPMKLHTTYCKQKSPTSQYIFREYFCLPVKPMV
jgi:hypothetical protein